jgi:hypothetical protein
MKTNSYAAQSATTPLAPFNIQRRDPGASDVQIEILYCGVCHSDVHTVRNEWHGTTYPCVDEQKDVSMLRFIKREHSDVRNLIKKIAAASGAGSKLLEEFARRDPSIILDDFRLPPGEESTRDAIASTKKKELLSQTGDEFELTLLLTQTEALSYAWHLAKVAGENEPDPERARALAGVSKDMRNFYHEVFVMLLSKTKS